MKILIDPRRRAAVADASRSAARDDHAAADRSRSVAPQPRGAPMALTGPFRTGPAATDDGDCGRLPWRVGETFLVPRGGALHEAFLERWHHACDDGAWCDGGDAMAAALPRVGSAHDGGLSGVGRGVHHGRHGLRPSALADEGRAKARGHWGASAVVVAGHPPGRPAAPWGGESLSAFEALR